MKKCYNKYNFSTNTYVKSGRIDRERLCNGFSVFNTGDTTCEVNGMPIFPSTAPATIIGDGIGFGGNEMEIYKGEITLSFRIPLGAAPSVVVIQKFFIFDTEDEI